METRPRTIPRDLDDVIRISKRIVAFAGLIVLGAAGAAIWVNQDAFAQRPWMRRYLPVMSERLVFPSNEFAFCRIKYTSSGESRYDEYLGRWAIDFPESDRHFMWRLSELTTIDVSQNDRGDYQHVVLELTDDKLYDYPFIYMLEVGYLQFTEEEVVGLRNYLLRGGFLMVDDFWGGYEWANWEYEIGRVFDPLKYPMMELPLTHPVFNMVFELDEKPQVPSEYFWSTSGGRTSERGSDSAEARYLGISDKDGRLMVVVCHNTDLGDGWEREGVNEAYFNAMSAKKAYPMGINIVVYALTH